MATPRNHQVTDAHVLHGRAGQASLSAMNEIALLSSYRLRSALAAAYRYGLWEYAYYRRVPKFQPHDVI